VCQAETTSPPQPPAFGPGAAFACFGACLGAQILVGVAATIPFAYRGEQPTWLLPVMALASMAFGALALWICVRGFLGGPVRERGREIFGLYASSPPRNVCGALAGAGLAALSLVVPLYFVPPPESGGLLQEMFHASGFGMVALIVLALFVAPPLEEFLFRGVMYHGLRRRLAPWLAALIVTVIFVGLHVFENFNYWPAIVSIALLAVLLIVLRMRFESLAPALAAHFAFNGVMIAVAVVTRA
jgi:membrane protease YdiL (CAAX protease family)